MFCVNCTYGDSTPATHDVVGIGPKCCYDNDCDTGNCKNIISQFVKNQLIDGWVTLTNTGDENIIYGPFKQRRKTGFVTLLVAKCFQFTFQVLIRGNR